MNQEYNKNVQARPSLQTRYTGFGKPLSASVASGVFGCAAIGLILAFVVIAHDLISETNTEVPESLTIAVKKSPRKKAETPVSNAPDRVVTVPGGAPLIRKQEESDLAQERPEFVEISEPETPDLLVLEELDEHPFEEEKEVEPPKEETRTAQTETKPARRKGPSRAELEERERRRRAALASKITQTAKLVGSRVTPHYPRSARRKGLEGRVVITVTVGPSGKVSQCSVSQSSGHAVLDQSALSAARRHRFIPAKNGLGQPVSVKKLMPFNFRLAS